MSAPHRRGLNEIGIRCNTSLKLMRAFSCRRPGAHPINNHNTILTAASTLHFSTTKREDYFNVLGLERSFTISQEEVKSSYKALMSKLHPDKQYSQQQQQQQQACDGDNNNNESSLSATDVTRAYEVIKRPHSRALHLLELETVNSDNTDSAIIDDEPIAILGNEFLVIIMEIRQDIDDAKTDEEIKILVAENDVRMKDAYQKLTDAFSTNSYEMAKSIASELRYWETCDETLREKLYSVD